MNTDTGRRKKGSPDEGDWLRARGYDGLYHPDPVMACGCFIGDLRPCGDVETPCRGGRAMGDGIYQGRRKVAEPRA